MVRIIFRRTSWHMGGEIKKKNLKRSKSLSHRKLKVPLFVPHRSKISVFKLSKRSKAGPEIACVYYARFHPQVRHEAAQEMRAVPGNWFTGVGSNPCYAAIKRGQFPIAYESRGSRPVTGERGVNSLALLDS
jgi:hypothetical protein